LPLCAVQFDVPAHHNNQQSVLYYNFTKYYKTAQNSTTGIAEIREVQAAMLTEFNRDDSTFMASCSGPS